MIYVSLTGDDLTGDGSSGAPYATIAHALSTVAAVLTAPVDVSLAPGTYAEALDVSGRLCAGLGRIRLVGSGAAAITGTITETVRGEARQTVVLARGPVRLCLEGITIDGPAAFSGILASDGAVVELRDAEVTTTGLLGIAAWDGARIELAGAVNVQGWTWGGFQVGYGSHIAPAGACTLTVTGPNSGWGIHLVAQSAFMVFIPDVVVRFYNVQYGFQLGFSSHYSHQGANGSTRVENATTPANSAVAQCTDQSSWSTNKPLIATKLTRLFHVNSISYAEAVGTRTLTSVGPSSASQNGVVYLP